MTITDLAIVRRSITGRPFLSVTTILTVAVAVCLLLTLLETKDAGFDALTRGGGDMQLLVSRDSSPLVSVLNGVFFANAPRRSLAWTEYEDIAARFPLEYAIPTLVGDSYRGNPVVATTPEFFTEFSPRPDSDGWTLADGRFLQADWDVVLGAQVARRTGLGVGDDVHLAHGLGTRRATADSGHHEHEHDEFHFTVVGILDPTGTPCDRALFTTLESSWIVHAHDLRRQDDPSIETTTADDLEPEHRLVTGIYLRVRSREGSLLSGGMQQVFDELRRDTTITVAQPSNQIRGLFAVISGVEQVFTGLVGVVMVSSAVAIALALYNSTEHRRRQIATLRVLGFHRRRIFGLVLTESAMLGLIGGATGIVLSMIGTQVVSAVLRTRFGLELEPELVSRWTLTVLTLAMAMAVCAGVAPAVIAYRVPVVKSLSPLG